MWLTLKKGREVKNREFKAEPQSPEHEPPPPGGHTVNKIISNESPCCYDRTVGK